LLFASLGSDGTDGPTDAAGATASFATLSRARDCRLSPADFLRRNDSYHFFEAVGELIKTGPTRTNVMDLHFILVGK
ncbi:MAG TPA: MOFRL family protein, partial [Acidobacteriota bacterium]|nr:MOFRL family protein [Acidobacteriota bacterium]